MSRRTIVRRARRQPVFVPLWLKRIHMAGILKALDLRQVTSAPAIPPTTYMPRAPYTLAAESDDV